MSSCLVVSVTAVAGPPRRSDRAPDRRSDGPARVRRVDLDVAEAARGELRAELVRRAGEDRERPVVHRQRHRLTPSSSTARAAAVGSIVKWPPIGRNASVRPVPLADEPHVAEHVGVAGEVEPEAVLELDDEADRLAEVERRLAPRRRCRPRSGRRGPS